MTAKQAKALSALLNNPTQERAAAAAGIGISTLKRYLSNSDFQAEYQKAMSKLIEGAATQAKQSLSNVNLPEERKRLLGEYALQLLGRQS